jgi:hypothetical protein
VRPQVEHTLFWWRIGPDDSGRLSEIVVPDELRDTLGARRSASVPGGEILLERDV